MKKIQLYCLGIMIMCALACASDASQSENNGLTKQVEQSSTAASQGNQNAAVQKNTQEATSAPNTAASTAKNATGANATSQPKKATFNAGRANKLGAQNGKKFCECKKKKATERKKCQEDILKRKDVLEKSIDPRIFKYYQMSFEQEKAKC